VGKNADVVFVMVMTGDQAKSVILGEHGLVNHLPKGGVVILSATVKPREAAEIAAAMQNSGIRFIDSPVSGGFPGAQSGNLTLMAAGAPDVLDECEPIMQAVSKTIHRVGTEGGQGQTVKACLQAIKHLKQQHWRPRPVYPVRYCSTSSLPQALGILLPTPRLRILSIDNLKVPEVI